MNRPYKAATIKMNFDSNTHHRRSVRLQGWDYSWPWWYYITICTHERECIFGRIVGDAMQLNGAGVIVNEEWLKTPSIRSEVELDEFVVMPNHLHGIIIINNPVGTHGRASLHETNSNGVEVGGPLQRKPRSLGAFVAGFKSAATKRINALRGTPRAPVWQGRFHDHIIRNDVDLHRIRTYIANNLLQWALDEENPENRGKAATH
jgi:putative transposase